MVIKFLKAFQGDCIVISFKDSNDNPRNILVDGGIDRTYYDTSTNTDGELKKEVNEIRKRKEFFDLLILTHIDNDHIGGLIKWFEQDPNASELVKNVWFNSGKLIAEFLKEPENPDLSIGLRIFKTSETGVPAAIEFENYLLSKKIWDREIIYKGIKSEKLGVKIQILSPNKTQLKRLLKEYKIKTGDPIYTGSKEKDWNKDLKFFIEDEESADFEFKPDSSPENGSSISFILTIQNKNFLFLADSHSKDIVESLKELGSCKEFPIEVELIKVSHHGSKRNTNKELLELIKTDNYIISTDSASHGHPNKRTIARIIKNNPNAILHFNYKNVKEGIMNTQDFADYSEFKIKVTKEFPFGS